MKGKWKFIPIGVIALIGVIVFFSSIGSVDSHEYVVTQNVMSGAMDARMEPGMFNAFMKKEYPFDKVQTVYFATNDKHRADEGIPVIFSDNSKCTISGSVRMTMPNSTEQVIAIVNTYSNRTFSDFEAKNVRPQIRTALITAASLMTAPDGKIRMTDLANMAQDMLNNGAYLLEVKTEKIIDPLTGDEVSQIKKSIRIDKNTGNYLRYDDNIPMKTFGVTATNFVVSDIMCDDRIEMQITQLRDNRLAMENEKSKMALAEQKQLTAIKEGDAYIAKIQKEEEAKAQLEIVSAERNKQTAIIKAQESVEVAKLNAAKEKTLLEAAQVVAQRTKVLADAEAYAKQKAIQADNALEKRLATYETVMKYNAEAIRDLKLPQVLIMGGTGANNTGGGDIGQVLMGMMATQMVRDGKALGIDMTDLKK